MPATTNPWMLVSYRRHPADDVRVGVHADGVVRAAPDFLGSATMLDVLASWDSVSAKLQSWSPEAAPVMADAQLVAPVSYPSKVICAGANYYGHLREMGITAPENAGLPYFFLKPPNTTVIGPDDRIVLPSRRTRQIDWEAELAVVIGRRARHVRAEQARDHVAGYTIVNDISARDQLARTDAVAPPFVFDWLSAKGEDTFCPTGPGIVPDWLIDDPQRLAVRLSVNGVVKQDSSTADMVCGVWDLIAEASRLMTLEPGDIIATGTPAGVGVPRGDFLAPGDEVVVEIENLGQLRNVVVDAD